MTIHLTLKQAAKSVQNISMLLPVVIWAILMFPNEAHGQQPGKKKQVLQINKTSITTSIDSTHRVFPTWIQLNRSAEKPGTHYNLQLDTTLLFRNTHQAYGRVDTVPFKLSLKDKGNKDRNLFEGICWWKAGNIHLSFRDSVLVNYTWWRLPVQNELIYSTGGVIVHNFILSRDSSILSASSRMPVANSMIDLSFKQVAIRDIAGLLNNDTLMVSGLLNAKLVASGIHKALPAITGTASVNDFYWMEQAAGNLDLNAQAINDTTIRATLQLTGNNNTVNVTGDYFPNSPQQPFNAILDIKQLQAGFLQALLEKQVSSASGTMSGLVELKGTFNKPLWNGNIGMDSVQFRLKQLNVPYTIRRQNIALDYPSIRLNRFTVNDSLGNPLTITGSILSQPGGPAGLNLLLDANNFSVINTTNAINNQWYGYAGILSNIAVSGNTKQPVLKGEVVLNELTTLKLVLPEKNTSREAAKSVVRFIDADTFAFTREQPFKPVADQPLPIENFLHKDLHIRVNPQTAFTVIIDPTSGDELTLKGKANLLAGVLPEGTVVLAGSYLPDSGYYELNYQYLKKRFDVRKGSKLIFNGKPTDASIDIRSAYIAHTAPNNLLGNEVGVIDPAMVPALNKKLPFEVILNLKGSFIEPAISFDLQLPPQTTISSQLKATIQNKLVQLKSDVAATNKQAFALLVMDRFVGEQTADFFRGNGNATAFSDIAKVSVSQFLAAALDEIASDLFKGINVDLNLNSYQDFIAEKGTQKSDLGIEVSKSFLNDRLSVTVGRTYGIDSEDGSAKASRQKGTRFLPDVTVNYKLTGDGKYLLRSYQKDQFEVILDGYVVETGLAFIITMDYEKFRSFIVSDKNKNSQ